MEENPYQVILKGNYPPLYDSEKNFIPEDWFEGYIDTYISTGKDYLFMLQGDKKAQRDWWLYNAFKYRDSKYYTDALKYADEELAAKLKDWCRQSEENYRRAEEVCTPLRERAKKSFLVRWCFNKYCAPDSQH